MQRLKTLALFFGLLSFISCNPIEYEVFGTIEGTVLDVDTYQPIENVYVTLSPSNKNTMTTSDGKFSFSDLDANQYSITVQMNGYETNIKTVNVIASETTDVIITMKKKDY